MRSSAVITAVFESLLLKAKIDIGQIACLAVGVGPGRFTGVRCGVNFAKTLAFCYPSLALYPVSSLKILAAAALFSKPLCEEVLSLVNAFKSSVYTALYRREKHGAGLKEILPPQVMAGPFKAKELQFTAPFLCAGDGYNVYPAYQPAPWAKHVILKTNLPPLAFALALVFKEEFLSLKKVSWQKLQPVYLRSPVPVLT